LWRCPQDLVVHTEETAENSAVGLAVIGDELVGIEQSETFQNPDPVSQTDGWWIMRFE